MTAKLLNSVNAVIDYIINVLAIIAGVLVGLSMVGINIDVFMRFVFNHPIFFIFPLTEMHLLFVTFFVAPWLLKTKGHVRMDFVVSRLSAKNQNRLDIFSAVIGIIVCFILVWYGTKVTHELWISKEYDIFKLEGFPKAITVSAIPIGSFFLLIQFFRDLWSVFNKFLKPTKP